MLGSALGASDSFIQITGRAEFEEMEQHFEDLGEADFRLYKAMQEWHNRIGDMLAYRRRLFLCRHS